MAEQETTGKPAQADAPEKPVTAAKARGHEDDPVRRPLGVRRRKLDAAVPRGMKGRWIADRNNRLRDALDAGYQFVNADGETISPASNQNMGDRVSTRGGTDESGKSYDLFLMVIDQKLYDQDQARKARDLDDTENLIRRGKFAQQSGDERVETTVPISIDGTKGSRGT